MKKPNKGQETHSDEHTLAAAILADVPYVVTQTPKPKKEKKKNKKPAATEVTETRASQPRVTEPPATETTATIPTSELPAPEVPITDPKPKLAELKRIEDYEILEAAGVQALELQEVEVQELESHDGEEKESEPVGLTFRDLSLPDEICSALESAGYRTPTDIQAATIPAMLEGRDVLGQAQTGTGKTAAFALPLLANIDVEIPETQVLVLTPTRELANQVSESFLKYGQHLRGLRVAPIYGGAPYVNQINALKRGAHVVVGTPGRVMDHMRESRLRIESLKTLVLDEADEMLRMGFVEDVQWILDQCPSDKQIALFSATMPEPIRQIANKHLKTPKVVKISSRQQTADNIEQRFLVVEPSMKLEALTRIIEAEEFDGMIIFVKTKMATVEVADYLREHGYAAAALNGDIAQNQRERTVEQLKEGVFNILVATDVAARGLDVQRITHVINYDLPMDSEAYVHRIGRTGRAGRKGHAIVFVAPKQRGFLREIDRAAGDSIEPMSLPTAKEINSARVEKFKQRLVQAAAGESNPELFATLEKLIAQTLVDQQLDPLRIIAGMAVMMHGDRPFFIHELPERLLHRKPRNDRPERAERFQKFDRESSREQGFREQGFREQGFREQGPTETFRVEVGRVHGVKPGNIVGAIVNEIGLDPAQIGHIRIEHDYSTVDLPSGMSREVFKVIGRAWVLGRQLRISKLSDHPGYSRGPRSSDGARGHYARKPRPEGAFREKRFSEGGKPKRDRKRRP
jgi:ATP-dependent RNA helicase DeaD